LIEEEVGPLWEEWMREIDSVLARMRLACEVALERLDLDHLCAHWFCTAVTTRVRIAG
jgi:hypothetical protein